MSFRTEKTAGPKSMPQLSFGRSEDSLGWRDPNVPAKALKDVPRIGDIAGATHDYSTLTFPGDAGSTIHGRKIDLPTFATTDHATSLVGLRDSLRAFNETPDDALSQGDTTRGGGQRAAPPDMPRRGQSFMLVFAVGAVIAVVAGGFYVLAWPSWRGTSPSPGEIAATPSIPTNPSQAENGLPSVAIALEPVTQEPTMLLPIKQAFVPGPEEPKTSEPSVMQPDRRALSQNDILEAQVRLKAFGFDPGPLDGVVGPLTMAAVERYEAARGRQLTGDLNRDVLGRLRLDTSESTQLAQPAARPER